MRRAFPVTSSASGARPWGMVGMSSAASLARASSRVRRARFTRRNTGARCCKRRMTGAKSAPRLRFSAGASQSGQSRATSSSRGAGSCASASVRNAGACRSPVNSVAGSTPAARSPPRTRPRPVSLPPSAAKDRRQRSASNTVSRTAALSPDPAKRLARPQLVKACSAGVPASTRSSTAMAADRRAAGVMG